MFGMGFYNQNAFPPPNRYFGPDRIGSIEPMFQQLKARNMLPEMYAAIDQEEKSLTDWRKVYPELLPHLFPMVGRQARRLDRVGEET